MKKKVKPLSKKKMLLLLFIVTTVLFSQVVSGQILTSDPKSTIETKTLYYNLTEIPKNGVMFGHQDDLTSGFQGKQKKDSSDIKTIANKYPAVFGWDIGKIEINDEMNFEGVSLARIEENIKSVYNKGGINTISWLCNNPINTEETAKSRTDSTIYKLFSDKSLTAKYNGWLDRVATFLNSLKDSNQIHIPIILRLFHENTGNWFWWGKSHCTPEEYKHLWIYTVDYLKNHGNVHNVLYAYCTDKFDSSEQYLQRYPGDEYVDLIGSDIYDNPGYHKMFLSNCTKMVSILKQISDERKKPFAIMETGFKQMPVADWWTNSLFPCIDNSGLSYILIWRNSSPTSYWGTYSGQISADNFVSFSKNKRILFLNDLQKFNVYKSNGKNISK